MATSAGRGRQIGTVGPDLRVVRMLSGFVSAANPTPVRPAIAADAATIAAIYNQGIEQRVATFDTRLKRPEDIAALVERDDLVLVAEHEGEVAGFAKIAAYEARSPYYEGVGEVTLYVERGARRLGLGRALLGAIAEAGARQGRHKLVAKVFAANTPSLRLFEACGYRRVGLHERHARLDGEWRDVIVFERFLLDG